jgi:hypothetical protein
MSKVSELVSLSLTATPKMALKSVKIRLTAVAHITHKGIYASMIVVITSIRLW